MPVCSCAARTLGCSVGSFHDLRCKDRFEWFHVEVVVFRVAEDVPVPVSRQPSIVPVWFTMPDLSKKAGPMNRCLPWEAAALPSNGPKEFKHHVIDDD